MQAMWPELWAPRTEWCSSKNKMIWWTSHTEPISKDRWQFCWDWVKGKMQYTKLKTHGRKIDQNVNSFTCRLWDCGQCRQHGPFNEHLVVFHFLYMGEALWTSLDIDFTQEGALHPVPSSVTARHARLTCRKGSLRTWAPTSPHWAHLPEGSCWLLKTWRWHKLITKLSGGLLRGYMRGSYTLKFFFKNKFTKLKKNVCIYVHI